MNGKTTHARPFTMFAIIVALTASFPWLSISQTMVVAQEPIPDTTDGTVEIIVVYDNYQFDPELGTEWGFGCVVKTPDHIILFDTGGNGSLLLSNMEKMKIAPQHIQTVVISHIHGDHLGGLKTFLRTNSNVKVHIPASFPNSVRDMIESQGAEYQDVKEPTQIAEYIYSTGQLGTRIQEQSLILDTHQGLVIITGCAHPGIVDITRKAKEILPDKDIFLVMGGFHLLGTSDGRIRDIIKDLKQLGVQKVAPSHCSGDRCIELFRQAFGENHIQSGAGKRITF
jgi:7,8-dihydropterin-6-yl-methyl-4-(beta-D-ribofuranosyl)aminobenzene 5'-phosphate synthase